MTTEKLMDWHAIQSGWKNLGGAYWTPDKKPSYRLFSHSFPHTLDGAASAMPDESWWLKNAEDGGPIYWFAFHRNSRYSYIVIPDSGDEIHDRYLLAKLAKEAMNAQSR